MHADSRPGCGRNDVVYSRHERWRVLFVLYEVMVHIIETKNALNTMKEVMCTHTFTKNNSLKVWLKQPVPDPTMLR
jgi:hypothetical protein